MLVSEPICNPCSAQAPSLRYGAADRDRGEWLHRDISGKSGGVDHVGLVGHHPDMALEEDEVAAREAGLVGEPFAERALLVAVARRMDTAQAERELDEAGAIDAVNAAAAEEIGCAEEPLGDMDRIMLPGIELADLGVGEEAAVGGDEPQSGLSVD